LIQGLLKKDIGLYLGVGNLARQRPIDNIVSWGAVKKEVRSFGYDILGENNEQE
jgi:hypothetical protein